MPFERCCWSPIRRLARLLPPAGDTTPAREPSSGWSARRIHARRGDRSGVTALRSWFHRHRSRTRSRGFVDSPNHWPRPSRRHRIDCRQTTENCPADWTVPRRVPTRRCWAARSGPSTAGPSAHRALRRRAGRRCFGPPSGFRNPRPPFAFRHRTRRHPPSVYRLPHRSRPASPAPGWFHRRSVASSRWHRPAARSHRVAWLGRSTRIGSHSGAAARPAFRPACRLPTTSV